jgi:hypothetical protein
MTSDDVVRPIAERTGYDDEGKQQRPRRAEAAGNPQDSGRALVAVAVFEEHDRRRE